MVAATVGFCAVEEKLLGPLQEYVGLAVVVAASERVDPIQMVLLLDAEGASGIPLTVILYVAVWVHPFAFVPVTV